MESERQRKREKRETEIIPEFSVAYLIIALVSTFPYADVLRKMVFMMSKSFGASENIATFISIILFIGYYLACVAPAIFGSDTQTTEQETINNPETQKVDIKPLKGIKPLKEVEVPLHNIAFKPNYFTYTEQGETQKFQLADIDKIVLFGSNSPNQSLNIYYDKGKVYTFYNDMKDWKALLDKLKAHFNISLDTKTMNGKLVLYEKTHHSTRDNRVS